MTGPLGADERVAQFAALWRRAIGASTFIPSRGGHARTALRRLTADLAAALVADDFDAGVGRRVGARLVELHAAAPDALRATLALLGRRLLTDLGITRTDAPQRLTELLAQVAAGFAEALHRRDLAAGESINRAERVAWRDKERSLGARLQHALLHDQVTSLPNRASLTRWLQGAVSDPAGGQRLGVCVLRLDGFDDISDSLGPEAADRLMRTAARHLRAVAVSESYYLAQLDHGEFAFVIEHTTGVDEVVKAAEEAMRALPSPCRLAGHDITVSARAGVVERPCAQATPDELLRAARQAVGWATADDRPWMVYAEPRDAADRVRYALSAAMPGALRSHQFHLAYQPLRRLRDGSLVGVEALARWTHPTHGEVPPERFIPLANRTGLINALGEYFLDSACTLAARWPRLLVSVNVSTVQLRHSGLPAAVAGVLDRTGIDPDRLMLEVTEDAFIHESTIATLYDLRRLGVHLAIDDFGTGYSNLAALRTVPANVVKLDASFLTGHDPERAGTATMLSTIIGLAHDLELTVIAEGVETRDQAELLADLGCDIGQGHGLGHPTTPAGIGRLLATS